MNGHETDEEGLGEIDFRFETTFTKHVEAREVLDFSVTLKGYEDFGTQPKNTVAHLKGFLIQPGYLPHMGSRGWYFDLFDMRSQHAMLAYHVLADNPALLEDALEGEVELENLSSVALIERIWVHSALRGHRLAQRLLREARHALSREGLLVLMKAHPDERRGARKPGDLASYYRADDNLKLREVEPETHPGWLVAAWEGFDPPDSDDYRFDVDVGSISEEHDPHDR